MTITVMSLVRSVRLTNHATRRKSHSGCIQPAWQTHVPKLTGSLQRRTRTSRVSDMPRNLHWATFAKQGLGEPTKVSDTPRNLYWAVVVTGPSCSRLGNGAEIHPCS
jgi:hypothetical protein